MGKQNITEKIVDYGRNCKIVVTTNRNTLLDTCTLISYTSVVAKLEERRDKNGVRCDRLLLGPDFDSSRTTAKHMRWFLDYCGPYGLCDKTASQLRKMIKSKDCPKNLVYRPNGLSLK